MTEFDLQTTLFNYFLTLNEFSGIEFLTQDGEGNYTNVWMPNQPFSTPEDKRWFELTFRNDAPSDVAIGEKSQKRFAGVLYIDIITPQDTGEKEAQVKYSWIAKLFNDTDYIGDVVIENIYISTRGNEADHYRLQVAIEWTADIDKEIKE